MVRVPIETVRLPGMVVVPLLPAKPTPSPPCRVSLTPRLTVKPLSVVTKANASIVDKVLSGAAAKAWAMVAKVVGPGVVVKRTPAGTAWKVAMIWCGCDNRWEGKAGHRSLRPGVD